MSADLDAALARYADFFASLTPADLARLDEFFTADAAFRDPFNDVTGVAAIRRVFEHMYESCSVARFEVHAAARSGEVGLLAWTFHFRLRRFAPERQRRIEGMSRVLLAADGRVAKHVDHWDAAAQVYESLPLVGGLLRMLRRRLQAS